MKTFTLDSIQLEVWLAVLILVSSILISRAWRRKKYHLPPGPTGLPVVGYLPFLTKKPFLKFVEISKGYGDVFSIYFGSRLVVILNNAQPVREAFGKRELLARPPESPFDALGLVTPFFSADFPMWQEQRRFMVHSMKDLGLGKSKIEGHLQDEIRYFMSILEQSKGQPMNLLIPLTPSMSNNICSLVFGERYQYENPNRVSMDCVLNTVSKTVGLTQFHLFFPWLQKIPFYYKMIGFDRTVKVFEWMKNYTNERVQKHRETLDPKDVRDFIDSYLVVMQQKRENKQETTMSDATMQGCIMSLFGAGSETVRTCISWCLYVAAAFPEVQEKCRTEIREVAGRERMPEYPNNLEMPFTGAVIREVMRWKTFLPLNLLRYALDDVKVAGFDVPRGSIVMANFWAVHHDPRCWEDPDSFIPERFLDERGKLMTRNPNFMPFSVGKRSCPGENMAMMEVFLYFASILQRFRVSFPPGYQPDFEADYRFSYSLKPHELCFQPAK